MKERLITLGLALGALALFLILLFPKPAAPSRAPRPLTTGADQEGYVAVFKWLATTHVPVVDLHRRFDQLADTSVSPQATGNLLITTLPFGVVLHREEYAALDNWVGAGNTVLVLAALDDTPLWSAVTDDFIPELKRLTAIRFDLKNDTDGKRVGAAARQLRAILTPAGSEVDLRASSGLGLLAGVAHLATRSPLPSSQWQAQAQTPSPVLELAHRSDTTDGVLWLKASGKGAVLVSAYASLFSNAVIGKADNATLLSNIIAWSLQGGGRVIVDDAHQGALDEYDPAKFYADPRLHRTLLWLLALWLAWVLATQPLRTAAPNVGSRDESAMLRVTAKFLAGVLRPVATAQWLFDEFFDRLRRRHGLAHGTTPPWDWLAAHAGVARSALAELRELHARTQSGRKVNLVRLQQLISQISGQTS